VSYFWDDVLEIKALFKYLTQHLFRHLRSCFLVTYYFSQKILTQYSSCSSDDDTKAVDSEVAAFLHRFGTYLQIHSCLVFSAKVEAEKAIDQLLEVARHDPSHQEARKELTKANALTFYDAVRNRCSPHPPRCLMQNKLTLVVLRTDETVRLARASWKYSEQFDATCRHDKELVRCGLSRCYAVASQKSMFRFGAATGCGKVGFPGQAPRRCILLVPFSTPGPR